MSPVLCRTPLLPLGGRQGCGWLRAGHARTQAHTHAHIHPHRRAHTHAHVCTHTKCSTRTHVCRPSSFPGPELGDAGSERKPGPWSIFSQSSESLPVACPGWPGRRGRLRRKGVALGLLYPKGPAPHPGPDGGEPGGRTGAPQTAVPQGLLSRRLHQLDRWALTSDSRDDQPVPFLPSLPSPLMLAPRPCLRGPL